MLPEVVQTRLVREVVADQRGGRFRQQRLPAVGPERRRAQRFTAGP